MQDVLNVIFSVTFLVSVLRVATPLILPALGGLVSELGGVGNIALEGLMLAAACAGALTSAFTKNVWLGLLAGLVTSMLLAALLAFFHLNLKADLTLSAVAMNILCSGATIFVVYLLTKDKSGTSSLISGQMPFMESFFPGIKDVPVIGPLLNQNILTYAAVLFTGLVATFLYRTRTGIHLRAVGENPDAARSVGINVRGMRYLALILSGFFAGLGGIYLSMGYVKFFARDMTAGRGFIAIAAVYLGAKNPWGAFVAALAFGFAEALSIQLGNLQVPTQLVSMIPYVATLIALIVYSLLQRQRAITRQRKFSQAAQA